MDYNTPPTVARPLSRRELLRRSALIGGALGVPGFLTACGGPPADTIATPGLSGTAPGAAAGAGPASETPKRGGTLVIGMEDEISSLDPAASSGAARYLS